MAMTTNHSSDDIPLGLPPSNQVNATADPKVLAAYHLAMATGIPSWFMR